MIRNLSRLAIAMALMLLVAWSVLATSETALADEPANPVEVRLAFEEPRATGDSVSVSVLLTTTDGDPITRQPVDIFVTPDFFGERPLPLQTAVTNAQGRATITYAPTWEGAHRLTARFGGDEAYRPSEITAVLAVSGLSAADISEPVPLNTVRQWATPGAVAVAIAVWLILAGVLGRVGWGVWQAGRRSEERVPALPSERAIERLPGSTYR